MKTWYSIAAKAAGNGPAPAEISIFDEIGLWGVTAKQFIGDLRAIDADEIVVSINSPGGSVFDALAIYNGLRQHRADITVRVMGVAASAASLIAMAGDKIVMPENAFMMVHNPLNFAYGNASELREMADVLDKIGASLVATYVARTGKPEDEVRALLDAETWLSAEDAVALGFADQVEPALRIAASYDMDRLPDNVRASITPPAADPEPEPEPEPEPTPAATLAARIQASAIAHGVGDFADVFALNCTSFDDARSAIEEAREIVALCEIAKLPSMTASLIAGRTSLADARAKVIAARAAAAPRIHGGAGPESFHVPAGLAPVREPEPQPDALAKKLNFNNLYAARQAAKNPA